MTSWGQTRGRLALMTVIMALLLAGEAQARGARGFHLLGTRGSGPHSLALLGIMLASVALVAGWSMFVGMRQERARQLLQELARLDPAWDVTDLTVRVEETRRALMEAWRVRRLEPAAGYLTARMVGRERFRMKGRLLDPFREQVLASVEIVHVDDRRQDRHDTFWALVRSTVQARGPRWLRGRIHEHDELWKFERTQDGWRLGEIDTYVSLQDLLRCQAQTEGPVRRR